MTFGGAAAAYVEQNLPPGSGRLINEYSWGGYLAWRLQGRYQVLLDGNTAIFPAELWRVSFAGSDAERARLLHGANADAICASLASTRDRRIYFRPDLIERAAAASRYTAKDNAYTQRYSSLSKFSFHSFAHNLRGALSHARLMGVNGLPKGSRF